MNIKNMNSEIRIPFRKEITTRSFRRRRGIERVVIDRDCDYNDDCASGFWRLPDLKEFVVEGESAFFTIDGVLFYDSRKNRYKNFIRCGFLADASNLEGVILVAFPRAYPSKHYKVPDGVVGIACSAFCNAALESLTLPESLEMIGCAAFFDMRSLKDVYVPNKVVVIDPDHYEETMVRFDVHGLDETTVLDDMVVACWNDVRRMRPMRSEMVREVEDDNPGWMEEMTF